MNCFISSRMYDELNNDNYRIAMNMPLYLNLNKEIIFDLSNSGTWRMFENYQMNNEYYRFNTKDYVSASLFPGYDIIKNKPLIIIAVTSKIYIIDWYELYLLLTQLNQKQEYMPYVYFTKMHDKIIDIQVKRRINYYHYISINKLGDKINETNYPFEFKVPNYSITVNNNTIHYLDSPYYVHQYLSTVDNEFFKRFEKNIMVKDFQAYSLTDKLSIDPRVCFPVIFDTNEQANKFSDAFHARKLLMEAV